MPAEKLVGHHCPECGNSGMVERVSFPATVEFRGEMISVTKTVRRCGSCDAEWENTKNPDWRLERNRIYQERTGLDPRSNGPRP
jgi:hypothetical protein